MLGLLLNLIRPSKGAVLPGGILSDGDWAKMTSVNWTDIDTSGTSNWNIWNATDDT